MSWETRYQKKINTAEQALRCVESGMRVYIQPGCAEPETLVEALMQRGPHVEDVEIVHMMTMGSAPYVAPEMAGHFRHNAVFIGGSAGADGAAARGQTADCRTGAGSARGFRRPNGAKCDATDSIAGLVFCVWLRR